MKLKGPIELKVTSEGIGKNSGKKFIRCEYTIAGKKYSTFNSDLMKFIEGDNVEIETVEKGGYENLISITKMQPGSVTEQPISKNIGTPVIEELRARAIDQAISIINGSGLKQIMPSAVIEVADNLLYYILTGVKDNGKS